MADFFMMIAIVLLFIIAPFLFVYGLYKLADIGGGLFGGSIVSVYYAFWIIAIYAELVGVS